MPNAPQPHTPAPQLAALFHRAARLTGAGASFVGGLVLAGWVYNIPSLKSVWPGLASMKPNAAVGFILLGLSLWLVWDESQSKSRQRFANISASLVLALGALVLAEYAFGWNLGIDELLFKDPGAVSHPGRMALTTALCFVCLAAALLLWNRPRGILPGQILVGLAGLISLIALAGYLYSSRSLYTIGSASGMAVHTAATLFGLSLGLLAARPNLGLMRLVASPGPGGHMVRRLFPAVAATLIGLGLAILTGQRLGLYSSTFGFALMVIASLSLIGALIWWNARSIDGLDLSRQSMAAGLEQANAELERRVAERTADLSESKARLEAALAERLKVEQALACERDLLHVLLDNIPDSIYFKDTDSRFTRINRAQARVLGVRGPEDALGKTDADYQPSDLARHFRQEEQEIMESGQPLVDRVEFNPAADGQPRWFSATKVPVRDPQSGRVTGLVGVSRNITDRMQAEAALRASEERFRSLSAAAPIGIFYTDAGGRCLYTNPHWQALAGQSLDDSLGEGWAQAIHPEDRETVTAHWQMAIRAHQPFTLDFRILPPHGEERWVSAQAAAVHSDTGEVLGFVGTLADVSRQRHYETALRESEARHKHLIEEASEIIYATDPAGNITFFNPTATRLLQYSPDELLGRNYLTFIQPDQRDSARRFYGRQFIRKVPHTYFEVRVLAKDGTQYWLGQSVKLNLQDNRPAGFQVIARDITERKRAEIALHDANEKLTRWVAELEQRNREISLLSQLGSMLQACRTLEEAHAVIAQMGRQLFPGDVGALAILSPSRNLVEVVSTWGKESASQAAFEPDTCWALRRGRLHMVDQTTLTHAASPWGLMCGHILQPWPAAALCVPLMAQSETVGVLVVHATKVENSRSKLGSAAGHQLAQALADHVALALGNLRLSETLRSQSIRDPLTGLFNRRYLEETLERELNRAARSQRPVSILMIDLDHFKTFNDTFGHEAGDVVLKELANHFRKHIRVGDIACRYGGEEFTLIIPEATLQIAEQRAEQLREGVCHLHVEYRGQVLGPLTLSVGVAGFPDHGETAEGLLKAADAALYRAKHQGRNQIVVG